jgi:hypothetical protein
VEVDVGGRGTGWCLFNHDHDLDARDVIMLGRTVLVAATLILLHGTLIVV